ncbi:MAG: PAS domain-containing protein [Spirochaetaceae bacterium]|nr:PAS domain-containing protein [Spirochaetaceae bacterium]
MAGRDSAADAGENLYSGLFAAMGEGMVLCELVRDPAGRPIDYLILDANPAFSERTGVPREKAAGKTGGEAFGAAEPPCLDAFARVAATGLPERFAARLPPLARHLEIQAFRCAPERVAALVRDVTDRDREAEEHAATLRLFDLLLEHSPIYVFFKDEELRSLRLSRNFEGMLGRPLGELLGKSMLELFPRELAEKMTADDRAIIERGKVTKFEETLGERTYETVKFPIFEAGKPPLLAGFTIDVTERVEAKRRLAEALKEKQALLKELQHRVKNSFALISGIVGLEEGRTEDPGLRGTLADLGNRINSLGALYDILYATGDPGSIRLDEYLQGLCKALLDSYSGTAAGVRLGLRAAELRIDVKRAVPIGLLVNEIVTNALKHAFPGRGEGRVEIELSAVGDKVVLALRDDGVGLPPGGQAPRPEGLGLGLIGMIAQQLRAETESGPGPAGRGLAYRFAFPLAES